MQPIAWPSDGPRRVSVNSFGIGGTNSHLVMDDAFHYLKRRGLKANHATVSCASQTPEGSIESARNFMSSSMCLSVASDMTENSSSGSSEDTPGSPDGLVSRADSMTGDLAIPSWSSSAVTCPRLLIWTATDERTLKRVVLGYNDFCRSYSLLHGGKLERLAYTLAQRRSLMRWRSYAVVDSTHKTDNLSTSKAVRASSSPADLAVVFTGQGAQYAKMGLDLLHYGHFRDILQHVDEIYKSLGSQWSLFGMTYPRNTQITAFLTFW